LWTGLQQHGSQHLVTTQQHVAGHFVGQAHVVGQHVVAHAVGQHVVGQEQHDAVVQLVHWALVVHADVVADDAAHWAVTFVAANSESATNNANTATTFFTFSPPFLHFSLIPSGSSSFGMLVHCLLVPCGCY
jgi:hypothetical protein